MPISYRDNFIFFHIPRCAGTSVESYYGFSTGNPLHGVSQFGERALTLHHLTYEDVKKERLITQDTLDAFYKFTIIRDPVSRMVSDYVWQKAYDVHQEFAGLTFPQYLDFAERVITEKAYFQKIHYDHFRPMSEYCFFRGKRILDDIFILENIQMEMRVLENRIGMGELPWLHRSHSEKNAYKTTRNIDRVYALYSEDKQLYDEVLAERQSLHRG